MNRLHEQINGFIRLDGTLNPLPLLDVWKRSSSVFWVQPDFPASAMNFKVGKADKSGYAVTLAMEAHPERGLWRVYVPATYLTERAETYYKIVALDENNLRHVCGEGILRIHDGKIYDYEDEEVVGENCYALFPDGKWRRITVFTDTAGELSFAVEQEGLSPSEFEQVPSQPYAFNAQTSKYHAVTGFVDSSGEAYISVSQTGITDGTQSFAKNDTTGFYYRVQTVQDAAGVYAPVVGDQKQ